MIKVPNAKTEVPIPNKLWSPDPVNAAGKKQSPTSAMNVPATIIPVLSLDDISCIYSEDIGSGLASPDDGSNLWL